MSQLLDDRAILTALDPGGMLSLTEGFPAQCREAHAIASTADLPRATTKPTAVVLTGLGGSAAGGDFVRALFEAGSSMPFTVNRDYSLPAWVGQGSIVFCASYSGNTEETLSAYEHACKKGAIVIAISSGGDLSRRVSAAGQSLISVPGGQPPRTAMGYMMVPVLVACERLGLLGAQDYETAFRLLEECRNDWSVENATTSNPTKQLALAFHGKLPVLYGLGSAQSVVASRWKSQIHENSKTMAHENAFPELCHNEILGWVGADKQSVGSWVVSVLEFGDESPKMKARASVVEQLVGSTASFHHVQARGSDLLSRMLSLTYFGDFVSLYLARLMGVDPENIDSINRLKEELAKV